MFLKKSIYPLSKEDIRSETLNTLHKYHEIALIAQENKDAESYLSALWCMAITICGDLNKKEEEALKRALDELETELYSDKTNLSEAEKTIILTKTFIAIRNLHWRISRLLAAKGISLAKKTDVRSIIAQKTDD